MRLLNDKNVDVNLDQMRLAYEEASTQFNLVSGPLYFAAEQQWLTAHDMLQETKDYRHQVKQLSRRIDEAWRQYHKKTAQAFQDKHALMVDYCVECYDKALESDCEKMLYSIKRVMDRKGMEGTALKARLVTAREMAAHCVNFFRTYWRKASEMAGYEGMEKPFLYAEMSPALSPLWTLSEIMAKGCTGEMLAEDSDCRLALKVIVNRLYNNDWIDEMGVNAMRLNVDYNDELAGVIERYDSNH